MLDINVNEFVHMCIYRILLRLEMPQTYMYRHPMSSCQFQWKTKLPQQVQKEHAIVETLRHNNHFPDLQPKHQHLLLLIPKYQYLHLSNSCQDIWVKIIHHHLSLSLQQGYVNHHRKLVIKKHIRMILHQLWNRHQLSITKHHRFQSRKRGPKPICE